MSRYTRPAPLTAEHDRDDFSCGKALLDSWLRDRAHRNEASGASRTFVTCAIGGNPLAGYYMIAASAVSVSEAPGSVRRNMPDPVPVILLGRLAVDRHHQGVSLGASLLQDAVLRAVGAADTVGVRALYLIPVECNGQ